MPSFKTLFSEFYVLLTVHFGIIFVNNQLEAQFFFMYVYFYSVHVSIRRIGLVTFCVETAIYSGLLEERYKGG